MSALTTYCHWVDRLSQLCFFLLIASLPYPHHIQRPLMVAWFVFWVLSGRWYRPLQIRWRQLLPFAFLALYALWEIFSLNWSMHPSSTHAIIERHLAFLLVLPVALCESDGRQDTFHIWCTLIISTAISVFVYGLGYFVFLRMDTTQIMESIYMSTDKTWSNYLALLVVTYKHRLTYSITILLSFLGLMIIWPQLLSRYTRRCCVVTVSLITAVLLVGLVVSGSRQGILTLFLILLVSTIISALSPGSSSSTHSTYFTSSTILKFFSLLALLLLIVFFFGHFYRRTVPIEDGFQVLMQKARAHEVEPRIGIWYVFCHHLSAIPWHGVGAGCDSVWLSQWWLEDGFPIHAQVNYHAHNQFFSSWIDLGCAAPVLLLFFFVTYPFTLRRHRDWGLYLSLMFFSVSCTDAFFRSIEGVFLIVLALLLLHLTTNRQS